MERDWRPTRRHLVPVVVPVLASQVVITDLVTPMLMAEPVVSQQSVAASVRYLLSVTMTQIICTLARLPQWAWHPSHTPFFQSALYPFLTDHMFLPDLLQELVSLLAPDTAAFLTVFSLLVQHCQQEAASTKLVSPKFQSLLLSLSKLMEDQLRVSPGGSGQPPGLIQPLAC